MISLRFLLNTLSHDSELWAALRMQYGWKRYQQRNFAMSLFADMEIDTDLDAVPCDADIQSAGHGATPAPFEATTTDEIIAVLTADRDAARRERDELRRALDEKTRQLEALTVPNSAID